MLTQRLNHQFASLDSGSEIRNNLSISGSKDGSSCISAAGGSGSRVHSVCGTAGFDVHDASTSADSIAAQLVIFMGGLQCCLVGSSQGIGLDLRLVVALGLLGHGGDRLGGLLDGGLQVITLGGHVIEAPEHQSRHQRHHQPR
ncbi:hypothetical protein ACSEUP_02265 [Pseudomonas aeruginosa]